MILPYQEVIPEDLEKLYFFLIKMTVTDPIKILNRKFKQYDEAQYDLDRKADKISVFSSETWEIMNI